MNMCSGMSGNTMEVCFLGVDPGSVQELSEVSGFYQEFKKKKNLTYKLKKEEKIII